MAAEHTPVNEEMTPEGTNEEQEASDSQAKIAAIVAGIVVLLAIVGVILSSIWMLGNPSATETLRDIFIIWIAFIALLIGVALVILSIQVARLVNLLQNEIKPILENTNETINMVRGTALFVSENVTEPVVKLGSAFAGIQRFLQLLTPTRPKRRNNERSQNRERKT